MPRYKKILLSYILLLIILAVFVLFLSNRREQLSRLYKVAPLSILKIAVLVILYKLVNAFSIKKLMQAFEIDMPFKEWFGLSCVATMVNYFLPARSGILTRAFYMKNRYDFAYAQFLASHLGLYVFLFFAYGIFGTFSVCLAYFITGIFYYQISLFFIAVFIITGGFILSWKYLGRRNFKFAAINNIFRGLNYFRKQKRLLLILLAVNLSGIIILAARFFFAYQAIGGLPNFILMLIIASIVSFSFVIGVTPGDLGIKEALITITSAAVGLLSIDGAMVSIIDRGISFLLTFVLGAAFSLILFRELRFKR